MNKKADFIIQASILDKYIHMKNPNEDLVGARTVISAIKKNADLRKYFFGQKPSSAWVRLMFEANLFSNPPNVIPVENGYRTPFWDVSFYLAENAKANADVVLKVYEQIQTNNPLIHSDLMNAIAEIPSSSLDIDIQKIIDWINSDYAGWSSHESVIKLAKHLINESKVPAALRVFEALIQPVLRKAPPEFSDYWPKTKSRFDANFVGKMLWGMVPEFEKTNPDEIIQIIQNSLIKTLQTDFDAFDDVKKINKKFWMPFVGEASSETNDDYRDVLVSELRDCLKRLIKVNNEKSHDYTIVYLKHDLLILRRLAIYLISQYPEKYVDLIPMILLDKSNYDDYSIHTEIFISLGSGFPYLSKRDQAEVLKIIFLGPGEETIAYWKEIGEGRSDTNYVSKRKSIWIRDRLWMIRNNLEANTQTVLGKLIQEHGKPDSPELLVKTSGAFTVTEDSPLSYNELEDMNASSVFEFAKSWRPSDYRFGPNQISQRGLAEAVATVILKDPSKYGMLITKFSELDPVFANSLFNVARETWTRKETVPWNQLLTLASSILSTPLPELKDNDSWLGPKLSCLHLIESGLVKNNLLPGSELDNLYRVLSQALYDSSPLPGSDDPNEEGFQDVFTIALNQVRPLALSALFDSFGIYEKIQSENSLEQVFSKFRIHLENKLDTKKEPSPTVHALFGRYVWLLNKIDKTWFMEKVDKIFPDLTNDPDQKYFIPSWESLLVGNFPGKETFQKLKDVYIRGIKNYCAGKRVNTYLGVGGSLTVHIIRYYLWGDVMLSNESDENLVRLFFHEADKDLRGTFVHNLSDALKSTLPTKRDEYWIRAKKLWQWRFNEFRLQNSPTEFQHEIERFAAFPNLAPLTENIVTLWPLLEDFLPFCRKYFIWEQLEKYVASMQGEFPEKAILFYRLMHETPIRPEEYFGRYAPVTETILKVALTDTKTKRDAMRIIDLITRSGIHDFRRLYEENT